MKKSLLFLISICCLWLINGCGTSSPPPPIPVATHFSVTPATPTPTAGTAFNITVTALDSSNVAVPSFSGTVSFTSSDAVAVLPSNSPLTGGAGTFSVTFKTAGPQTIAVSAGGSLTGNSGPITVKANAATQFSVAPATFTTTIGAAFNFTVTALDALNNTATGYSGTVHFTSSDAQAALPGDSTLTNGVGTFSVTLKTSGSQTITATDTVTASLTGSASGIRASGPATHFTFSPQAAAATRRSFNIFVTALDASNNGSTGYNGTVHVTSTDGTAIVPASATLQTGSGNFPVTLETPGPQTVTVTDTVTPSIKGTTNSITVTATPALTITSGAPPNGTVASSYGTTSTVYEKCVLQGIVRRCSPCVPNTLAGCNAPSAPSCARAPSTAPVCILTVVYTGFELTGTGGVPPYTWTASALPPGLALKSENNGRIFINGTPAPGSAATYNAMVTLNDSGMPPAPMTATYIITIAAPPLVITSSNPPDGVIGTAYSATLSTSGGTPPVTWSVTAGALPAGLSLNANTGAITGTPTTAALSNFTVQAADSGTPQQTKTQALSINVNPPAVNNAELNGQYAFSFQGFDASGPVDSVGSFTADGAGNLTGGLRDVNRVTGVTASQAFIGTYEIFADNRGSFTLKTSPGGADLGTFRFAVGSLTAGVASKARFVEFDASGTRGAGVIEKQDPTAFSTAKITGDYAFGVSSAISSTASFSAAGRFTAAAGTIGSCSLDEDNHGTLKSNSTFTGTYTVAATGRGTLTMNVTGSANPLNADFYVVSAGELLLMSSDLQSVNPLFVGTILQQSGAGTFSNASLNTASVIRMNGLNSNGTADVVLGVLSIPSAGNFTLAADENNGGTVKALNQSGTYSVASNGRVTLTGTTHPPVFYLVGANKGFVVGTDSNATSGFFEPQTGGPFATGSANGVFFFGATTPVNANVSDESGVATFNGTGSVTGTTDSNKASGLFPDQAFTDTYTISANGRGTMTASSTILYLISPSKIVLMDGTVGASNSSITVGEK
jgi:Putative Ig domain